jgi:hypothetical protein
MTKFIDDEYFTSSMALLTLLHPVVASTAIILCYINASMGISRYGLKVLDFRRGAHISNGRFFIVLLYVAYLLGLYGIVLLGLKPFTTPHAYYGILLLLIFSTGVFFAFLVLRGNMRYVKIHGRIMLIGALLLVIQIVSGVANLRYLLGLI